jgi:acetate kinase
MATGQQPPVRILVVNAGSSSLKLRMLDPGDTVTGSADLPAPRGPALRGAASVDAAALAGTLKGFGPVDAVGHRVVHGGTQFSGPVVVTEDVRRRLELLTDLAPLHQPKSLGALDAVGAALPDVPAVACFDTAFHASIPAAAATYALPQEWRTRWTLRRYGFHGLSHSYASRRAAEMVGATASPGRAGSARSGEGGERGAEPSFSGGSTGVAALRGDTRVVTCHLGAGASLAAVQGGHSVDTTMGFTPLDGLVMATRSGSVDPGLVLWLEEHAGMPPAELATTLENRSGLLGLAGTADMREVLSRAASGAERAVLARDVYLHRLRASVAAMAAAMDGLDALVFTGGVGENSAEIRSRAGEGLGFLGIRIDDARNAGGEAGDYEITADGAPVRAFVVAAREDLEIADQVRTILSRHT